MGLDIKIQGVDELNKILAQLPPHIDKKIIVPGLKQAAKPLVAAIKSRVPVRTGTGQRSVGVITAPGIDPAVLVGPRTGKGTKYDGWYLRFIEYGTQPRKPRTLGKRALRRGGKQKSKLKFNAGGQTFYVDTTKGLSPRPFVRPAFDQNKEVIINSMASHVGYAVEKYFAKHAYMKK